jgi:hypothetical protein
VYMNSIDNLMRLRCVTPYVEEDDIETEVEGNYDSKTFTLFHNYDNVCMTSFGMGFVEACINPKAKGHRDVKTEEVRS